MRWGLALVLAGAIGNLFDRIAYGYVIDMIEVTFIEYPVFNLADNMVVIGTALFALYILFFDKTIFVTRKKEAVVQVDGEELTECVNCTESDVQDNTEKDLPDIQHRYDE